MKSQIECRKKFTKNNNALFIFETKSKIKRYSCLEKILKPLLVVKKKPVIEEKI